MAEQEGINLYNKRFDWSIKAVALQKFPTFFDWTANKDINPLDQKGQFMFAYSKFEEPQMQQEKHIYEWACNFEFTDCQELQKMIRQEELRLLREP